jgi:hypothetical protein
MRLTAVAACLVVCIASPLRAQSADSVARTPHSPGTYSLSFAAPGLDDDGATGTFGFWRMVSQRTNLGVFVTAGASHSTSSVDSDNPSSDNEVDNTGFTLLLGPAVRRYVAAGENVAPFLYGSAQVGYGSSRNHTDQDDRTFRSSGAQGVIEVGAGLEWFPTRALSVSGYTGLRAQALSQEGRSDATELDSHSTNIGTFTTALSVNLYFPRSR